MKYSLLIIAPVLMLAACDKKPENGPENVNATEGTVATDSGPDVTLPHLTLQPTDARTYLDKAAAGDSFEIESSRALLKTSKNPAVRNFANMMISAHQESSRKLRGAAEKLKLAAGATSLSQDQQQKLDAIKSAAAADVDQLYLTSQRSAHNDALDLHRHYASDGDTPALKEAAGAIAPVVQKHLDELDKLTKPQDGA
ncbi:DUF4142 domain-containing protein [Novosphingobium sediminicola]|uniref:Putative membrane protein n=1 Tax=Novosphingobium sediminicola TaxID=563162 RepID=A0A7W6CHK5_9SPHN|nr:DUF4142 domain-containing protein [Novosphingobium sediminicola]MBB3956654.1 putative membrane protein [Novosphingobium sediminicola]